MHPSFHRWKSTVFNKTCSETYSRFTNKSLLPGPMSSSVGKSVAKSLGDLSEKTSELNLWYHTIKGTKLARALMQPGSSEFSARCLNSSQHLEPRKRMTCGFGMKEYYSNGLFSSPTVRLSHPQSAFRASAARRPRCRRQSPCSAGPPS